jgi:hypothetical protein
VLTYESYIILRLQGLLDECQPLKDDFLKSTELTRERYFDVIVIKRDTYLESIFSKSIYFARAESAVDVLFNEVKAYAERCNWNYVDPIILMACFDKLGDDVFDKVARLGLIYQAFRMIDDLLDDHIDYKGGYPTLYGNLRKNSLTSNHVLASSILPALLMICEGLRYDIDKYTNLAQQTILRALYEVINCKTLSIERYYRIVEGKMVSYGMLLYTPLIDAMGPNSSTVMEPLLRRTFLLSQIANDLVDKKDDHVQGQPNFWQIIDNSMTAADTFLKQLFTLYDQRETFPSNFKPYVFTRLHDIGKYVVQSIKAKQ